MSMVELPIGFEIGGVLAPPLLIAALIAVVAVALTAKLLNRIRLSRYFFYPPLVLLRFLLSICTLRHSQKVVVGECNLHLRAVVKRTFSG